jgi:uncharacterized protein YegL
MTKPNKTELVFVVDRSGSMSSIAEAMSQGFNEFIEKQRTLPGECLVTTVQFDDEYQTLYNAKPLNEVPKYQLQPRGTTALLDALGSTIDSVGQRLSATPEHERPSQVLFIVITDGMENSSSAYPGTDGRRRIMSKIVHQRTKYAWEFVYLGANQDAIAVAADLGFSSTNSVTYSASNAGTSDLMRGLSTSVASYRSSGQQRAENLYNQASYDDLRFDGNVDLINVNNHINIISPKYFRKTSS